MARDCLVNHNIGSGDLRHGDHIYGYRFGYTYSHHGIYDAERSEVIHVTGDMRTSSKTRGGKAGVAVTSLNRFLDGSRLRLYTYRAGTIENLIKLNGSCSTAIDISGRRTVEIARWFSRHPGLFGDYSLGAWNCESFSRMCKTATFNTRDLDRQLAVGANIRDYVKARSSSTSEQGSRLGTVGAVVQSPIRVPVKWMLAGVVRFFGFFVAPPRNQLALR